MYGRDELPVTIYFYPLLNKRERESEEIGLYMKSLDFSIKNESILYIHIPFCISRCSFCPFNIKVISLSQDIMSYVEALIKEAEMLAPYVKQVNIRAVYYGGGSPSIIEGSLFYKLHKRLQEIFGFSDDVEITLEGELRTLSEHERLRNYKEAGVNRISFGCQTFNNDIRRLFNMDYGADDAISMIKDIASWNFSELNVDMMYGLPNQNGQQLLNDIYQLCNLPINSIDYYRLHPYSFPQKLKGQWMIEANRLKPYFVKTIIEELTNIGFRNVCDQIYSNVGLSKYAQLLWGNVMHDEVAYVVGIGASARGYLDGRSYMNTVTVEEYMKKVSLGVFPINKISSKVNELERKRVFSPKYFDIRKELLIGCDYRIIRKIKEWEKNGILLEKAESYQITEKGKPYIDEMVIDLMSMEQRDMAYDLDTKLLAIDNLRTGRF